MLKIEYVKKEDLKPYANNAKIHTAEQVEQIKKSIKEFGFNDPVAVWHDNEVIEGHGRLMAVMDMDDITEVPIIRLDDLSDEERKAYMLVHNKLTMNTDFDSDLLDIELDDILNIDMTDFGFELALDDEPKEVVEDELPKEVETRCKLGNLWQLGEHRLICGDSTDIAVIDRLMDGVKADMVFTDPPYGMNLDTDFSGMVSEMFSNEKHTKNGNKYEQGKVDEFHPEMIDAVLMVDADEMFLWGADYFAELLPNKNDGSWIVWDKRANGNDDVAEDYSSDKMYGSCFELCWSKKKHKRDIARVKWAGVFGTEQEFDHKRYHPTQKPIKLAGWFLDRYSKEGQVIIDLFGGSGSTLIACEQLDRKCYMAELDPHYCDVIIQRWENFTGRKAVKL